MKTRMATNPFDRGPAEAVEYDAWYDSSAGLAVLQAEERCIRELLENAGRPWLDLGTGSGRFGGDLGADLGLDPALEPLILASTRLPSVIRGAGEALPFRDASFGGVLAVAVFEFLAAPPRVMRETARVLRPGGRFVLGFFPSSSAWARAYRDDGRDPRSVFHEARFFSIADVHTLAAQAGFRVTGARSTLFEAPGTPSLGGVTDRAEASAGFVAIALTKPER